MVLNSIWWLLYISVAFGLQLRFPGLDALIPGVLIALQEQRRSQLFWLMLFCILVQEGTGTLAFGAVPLWYCSLLLLFYWGKNYFIVNSLFFVALLSAALGVLLGLIRVSLSSLQPLELSMPLVIEQSIAQALITPPLWLAASYCRNRFFRHDEDGL